ncbi:DNA/RNA non-specific endonuclease [Massilia sp. CCM 8734]|uniref:DNA/RNA non-specific endonuclease n=1 Tax=Massilia sp. CCM 8734 TaxID=2609283 RepID=UPI0014247F35|nr:DNA/RNA non-specific endonuclease [Massilia sp. CCM 8734]NIA00850.1 hypothetical protein [Massilia sp. CCM 8734]
MPDDKISSKPKAQTALSGTTRHAANETAWYAISTAPDYCKVGKSVVGFDTYAVLNNKATASPNVKAQTGAKPIYRVDDMVKGVQGNAGAGVCSNTSLDLGYLKFVSGQYNLRVNGRSVVIDGSRCLINCNAAGFGNAAAVVRTEVKNTSSKGAEEKSMLGGMKEEAGRVLDKEWSDIKKTAGTLWDARPFNGDEAVSGAARSKISSGIESTFEGLATLAGPPPEQVQGALMSGNPQAIAAVTEMQQQQLEAYRAIAGETKKSWNEAEARNGKSGATTMVLMVGALQFIGGKGAGLMARVGKRISEVVGLAKTPLEAAALLDKEITWAKAVGKSDAEIKMWRDARDAQLDMARKHAADPKLATGGVHVKKGRLTPNVEYELNGYKYKTDAEGRIKSAEGELRLESGFRRESQQVAVGVDDGRLPNDAGGHLVGRQFDGYGGKENLVPMGSINKGNGQWGQMETNWANRLKAGDTVQVKIDVIYNSATARPAAFDVTEIINGIKSQRTILNI